MLETAIQNSPRNVELRYLRLIVQLKKNEFIIESKQVEMDFRIFTDEILCAGIPVQWKKRFVHNLIRLKNIKSTQKEKLQVILENL